MSFVLPSGTNTFVPSAEATDGLIVGFSRNVSKFAINRYTQIVPVKESVGKFLKMRTEQFVRAPFSDARDNVWHDGDDRPTGVANLVPFEFEPYLTTRYDIAFTLGRKTIEQAQFAIQPIHVQMEASQMMVKRTNLALNALGNATWANHQANVDGNFGTLNGNAALLATGKNWTNGTPTDPHVKICLQTAALQINKDTQGVVEPNMLKLVISPDVAFAISQSPEIQAAFIQSQFALGQTDGTDRNINRGWGLPSHLYDFEVEVEGTVKDLSRFGDTSTNSVYAVPQGFAYLVARPGALVGIEGARNFSTVVGFFYEELTVEAFDDPKQRRIEGHVTSDFQYQVVAAQSGFQFQHVLGA
jgi:hypothetical protein